MKHIITSIAVVLMFGSVLLFTERHRQSNRRQAAISARGPQPELAAKLTVRAAGRIQGKTEEIELRSQQNGRIEQILVTEGQSVSKGDVLIRLDSDRLEQQYHLAAAIVDREKANKQRLENGSRPSEIETARQEYLAAKAKMTGAETAYRRAVELSKQNAVSQQTLDDRSAALSSLRASTAAAQSRLETLQQPPRKEDLLAADAALRAAESRLQIARENLEDAQLRAPSAGEILSLEAEVGELAGPDSARPLVIMADTSRLRAVAEIDEFDALTVQLGQPCRVTADGAEGILAHGKIVKIAPQMNRKQLFGHWAGERSDTYGRRVWVELEPSADLPVGMPIDLFIDAAAGEKDRPGPDVAL